jgi:DNA-binding transcriptional LysR family regulator
LAITVTQLNAFLALLRTGSVTAAAEELVVSQPSVSAALAALSRELGVELTEKVGRNLRLTPAGEAFAPFATDIVGLLDDGRRAAREVTGDDGAELRVAAVTTRASTSSRSLGGR